MLISYKLRVPFVTFPLDFAMNANLFEIIGKKQFCALKN